MPHNLADISGFVLAGGQSSRMGPNKALLELGGAPTVSIVGGVVQAALGNCVIVGPPDLYARFGYAVIGDAFPGSGPLGGIATVLCTTKSEWNVIVACDLPYLTEDWLRFLAARAVGSGAGAVLPRNTGGLEPLCAAYNKSCAAAIETALGHGVRKVTDGLSGVSVELVEPEEWKPFDSDGFLFKNMNSPADYAEAASRFAARAKR
jgi:molybdenum cofactor guanylyltransferase